MEQRAVEGVIRASEGYRTIDGMVDFSVKELKECHEKVLGHLSEGLSHHLTVLDHTAEPKAEAVGNLYQNVIIYYLDDPCQAIEVAQSIGAIMEVLSTSQLERFSQEIEKLTSIADPQYLRLLLHTQIFETLHSNGTPADYGSKILAAWSM